MKNWYILNRDGNQMEEEKLPSRPSDAKPENNQPFRPWYKLKEHVHVENGKIDGIHAEGTLENLQGLLKKILEKENEVLNKFGDKEDILLEEVKQYLNI